MLKVIRHFWCLLACLLLSQNIDAQEFYNISAKFSIKEKQFDGQNVLVMGKVYYDKKHQKVVYDIQFPTPEVWVIADTVFYKYIGGKRIEKQTIAAINQYSVFHLALTGQLQNFGLSRSAYRLQSSENQGESLVSTWLPPTSAKHFFGKIMTQQSQKRLSGVVVFDAKNVVLQKQLFANYQQIKGLSFPSEITQVTYNAKGTAFYKKTTFSDIRVNDNQNKNMYNFER